MRKYSFFGVENSFGIAILLLAMLPAAVVFGDSPLDVVKNLVSGDDKAEKTPPKPKSVDKSQAEPSSVGEACAISGSDGSLRLGRCNGSFGGGIFILPTNALGDRISEGMIIYKGRRYPALAFYNDVESGMTVLFTAADTGATRPLARGQFPDAGTKLLVNSTTPVEADVRELYGLGMQRAVQISGEVDEDNFIGYEVTDASSRIVGIVSSCEWVYNQDGRADICYVIPSSYINQLMGKADKSKTALPAPQKGILEKITPSQLHSYSQAKHMLFLRRYPQAVKLLRKLLHASPINAYAYRKLGDMYFEQHDFMRASECYSKAIELQPLLLACYPPMAQAMGKTDHPAKALDILLKFSPNVNGEEMKTAFAESFRLIGLDLISANQADKAVIALQHADKLKPGDAEICFALAEALMDVDSLPQSREYYRRYIKLAGPAWREYTISSPSGGDVVMDPRVMRAQRRIGEIDYKIRMRATQK